MVATTPARTPGDTPVSTAGGPAPRPARWRAMLCCQVDYWLTLQRRTWRGWVVSAFFTPVLYLAALGVMLGRYVDQATSSVVGAPSYLHFVAPGLLAGQAMLLAVGDATYPVYGKITWDRTYVGMLATPLRVVDVVIGHLVAIVLRVGLSCGIFMISFALFGLFADVTGALAAFVVQFVIAFAFAGPVFAFTAGLRGDSAFAFLHRVVQVPLYLFSGAFFPVEHLATPVQWVAKALPLWHGVELTRRAMLPGDGADLLVAAGHLAYLVALGALGWWLAVRRLTRRLIT